MHNQTEQQQMTAGQAHSTDTHQELNVYRRMRVFRFGSILGGSKAAPWRKQDDFNRPYNIMMLSYGWLHLPQLALVVVAIVALKMYLRGGVCRVRRDLSGKVIVITGGNTGIGKETMLDLASSPCSIVIGARDRAKSEEAVKEAIEKSGNCNIEFVRLDLGSRKSIEEFASFVTAKYPSVDYLINNAGVFLVSDRLATEDGFEMQMGVNHLGHFYLTSLLWKCLRNSKDLRIVNVSSVTHSSSGSTIDFEDLNSEKSYDRIGAYGKSKLANILFTKELARRLEAVKPEARVVSLHPGVVRTEVVRNLRGRLFDIIMRVIQPIFWLLTKSPREGAQTSLYAIYQSADKLKNGGYYSDCKLKASSQQSEKMQSQKMLWEVSEALLNHKFDIS